MLSPHGSTLQHTMNTQLTIDKVQNSFDENSQPGSTEQSIDQQRTIQQGEKDILALPYIFKPTDDISRTGVDNSLPMSNNCLQLTKGYNASVLHNDTSDCSSHLQKCNPSIPPPIVENTCGVFSPPPSAKSLTTEFKTFPALDTINATSQDSTLHASGISRVCSPRIINNNNMTQPLQHQQYQQPQNKSMRPFSQIQQQSHGSPFSSNDQPYTGRPRSMFLSTSSISSVSTFNDSTVSVTLNPPSSKFTTGSYSPSFDSITKKRYSIISDNSYYPDSSSYIASITEPAPNPLSLKPHHPRFPPATLENLNNFRREAQASPHNPALQLNFAKYLMEAVDQVRIDDAVRSIKAKNAMLSEAQRIVKTLAMQSKIGKSGFADAQFYLANAYGAGLMLLNVSHEKAFNLYLQGSKQSHRECTYRVGVCYELGLGTRRDNARAIQFYRKAANLGDPSAMYKLAMILLRGLLGQHKHPKEGISWLKRAAPLANAYHPEILHELGLAYEKEGIPSVIPDQDYARELLTKAARFGYAPSQYRLGLAYENGMMQCPIDARRSIAWYGKAAEQGHLESALALSGWYLTGAEGILPQNDMEAYLWAKKAADRGYAKGQYACGYYCETGIGIGQDLVQAQRWYQLAARQRYPKAIQRLAEWNNNNNNEDQYQKIISTKQQRKRQSQLQQQQQQNRSSLQSLSPYDPDTRRQSIVSQQLQQSSLMEQQPQIQLEEERMPKQVNRCYIM
ncbi:uncharacterized protein BX664DRAFT_280833 [Halteromyces radiatus]|uniref:uncharacterized protein n=1 Tax=Halteromyces radiatus TaxID=101107 RepID=UPI0022203AC7|nr:uncharacterized protein BX664DRAFT_280833 [Halteromyces radiatus]KAI8089695.1 hypothetical protein BX664DRAFT_280833 [Halteromyces radiatus]